jgi:hypothetical protein
MRKVCHVPLHVHKSDVIHSCKPFDGISSSMESGRFKIRKSSNFSPWSRNIEDIAYNYRDVVPHYRYCCPRMKNIGPEV